MDPLRGNFQNIAPKGFIATQIHVLCANLVRFGDRKSVKSCVIYRTRKKNKISARSPALASGRIAPKIRQGQRQTTYSKRPKFHPNRFTSGGVIGERVNTVQTRHKVFPILGKAMLLTE